ncbi:hypothetical protein BAXH7_03717 [Bacillus amyloliquefaciens XH7]|nr:hypothetical protein BAMTA208_18175 [Bacillus amyloliquefaciens TA208]AEK90829.1 hypothetical protein BAXH7_03717 [Bacillus amyloliquefaciens XH7]QBG58061.1 hypothetical protein D2M30_3762 [Bacillus amyloliquefaciens]
MRSAENADITGCEKMDYDCIFFFRNANSPFSPNEYPQANVNAFIFLEKN